MHQRCFGSQKSIRLEQNALRGSGHPGGGWEYGPRLDRRAGVRPSPALENRSPPSCLPCHRQWVARSSVAPGRSDLWGQEKMLAAMNCSTCPTSTGVHRARGDLGADITAVARLLPEPLLGTSSGTARSAIPSPPCVARSGTTSLLSCPGLTGTSVKFPVSYGTAQQAFSPMPRDSIKST